jgi:hypothetical protein
MVAMSESQGQRPRRVTIAGVMATAACVLLVVSLFDSMATVRSSAVRDQIAEQLSKPPGNGLGLDPAAVVDMLRALVLVSGALAAAGAVLAIFALQRHRGARVGLTVTAVLLLFSATFVSGILPILVAVAASMLWSRDARDWFAGRPPRPAPAVPPPASGPPAGDGHADTPAGMTTWRPGAQPGPLPGPHPGAQPGAQPVPQSGSQDGPRESGPPPAAYPYGTSPGPFPAHAGHPGAPYASARVRTPARPTAVTVAAWLTWVFAGLTAVFFLLTVVAILVDHQAIVEAMQRNPQVAAMGLSGREILGYVWVTVAVVIFWAFAAMALAVLAYRRVELGRILLIVSAAAAGLMGLVAVPVGWLNAAAAIACVVLLSRRSVRAWYAGQDLPPRTPPSHRPPQAPVPPSEKPPVW